MVYHPWYTTLPFPVVRTLISQVRAFCQISLNPQGSLIRTAENGSLPAHLHFAQVFRRYYFSMRLVKRHRKYFPFFAFCAAATPKDAAFPKMSALRTFSLKIYATGLYALKRHFPSRRVLRPKTRGLRHFILFTIYQSLTPLSIPFSLFY